MFATTSALLAAVGVIFITFSLKLFYSLLQEQKRGKKVLYNVGGIKPHWLLGHMREIQPIAESFKKILPLLKDFPKIGTFWIGPFVWYLGLHHPDVLPPILNTAEPKDYISYGFLKDWIGDGLLVSTGKKWQRNRRLLTRAFHFDILKEYTKLFNKCTNEMLCKWEKNACNEKVEIFEDVTLMTLDNMLQCTMSCETQCQTSKNGNAYTDAIFNLGQIVVKRTFNPLIHSNFIFYLTPIGWKFKSLCKYVHEFDEKIIEKRKAFINASLKQIDLNVADTDEQKILHYQKVSGKSLDFLDILLLTRDEDGKGLSDREIRDEVDTFLFEGHDTTASGISWTFYCLAVYPHYQEKCREEVQNLIGDKSEIEWSDLSALPFVSMFLKEALRLYSPVFFIARKTTKPIHFPRGFGDDQYCLDPTPRAGCEKLLESSTNINISPYFLHRNGAVWENPEVFDPMRFSPENSKQRSSFAYLPFSAGPRNCIGKNFAVSEMKVAMCKALQRFRFYVDAECPEPEILPSITLKAKDGIHIKMEPLKSRP